MNYLTGCANVFRSGYIDVNQFTLAEVAAELESDTG